MVSQTVNSSDLRNSFGVILDNALRGKVTVVERYGRPAGAFVPIEIYERYVAEMKGESESSTDVRQGSALK